MTTPHRSLFPTRYPRPTGPSSTRRRSRTRRAVRDGRIHPVTTEADPADLADQDTIAYVEDDEV